jgi:hypothetical protein
MYLLTTHHSKGTPDQSYKNQSIFLKFGENQRNQAGPNFKIVEILFTVLKFWKNIKISKIYVKKLDRILRLMMNFFCKT